MQGSALDDAVIQAIELASRHEQSQEVTEALNRALALSRDEDWRTCLPELGEGWVGEEALAIAVLCALAAETPREAIIAAVNHDGDTDSTGAIAGNIVGAVCGVSLFPKEWTAHVELRDVIEILAQDFATIIEGRPIPDAMFSRYPVGNLQA